MNMVGALDDTLQDPTRHSASTPRVSRAPGVRAPWKGRGEHGRGKPQVSHPSSMDVHARLRYARIAPRKVRRVAKDLQGLPVDEAEARLTYLAPRGAQILLKVLRSAVANAKHNFDLDATHLVIRDVVVNSGVVIKRFMPRARGSAYRIEKRTSHIDVVLTERTPGTQPRKGKKSEVLTRTIEELSREDLAEHVRARGGRAAEEPTGAVKRPAPPKSARQLTERRSSDQ